jgi:hypothetical protein
VLTAPEGPSGTDGDADLFASVAGGSGRAASGSTADGSGGRGINAHPIVLPESPSSRCSVAPL